MDRRAFLAVAAAGSLIAIPAVARAQQAGKVHRIGFLSLRSGPDQTTELFREGLRELGYVEGRNLITEYRWAVGKNDRLPELAAELVRLKRVDLIVTFGAAATQAAPNATKTIPIVGAAMGNPVRLPIRSLNEMTTGSCVLDLPHHAGHDLSVRSAGVPVTSTSGPPS